MGGCILKLKRLIKEGFVDFKNFGFKVMLAKNYCIIKDDSIKSLRYKYRVILEYLDKEYAELIEKYKNLEDVPQNTGDTSSLPLWELWWQGEDNMTLFVKTCHESKINNSNGHPFIFLHKDNLSEYIDFPDYVLQQFNSGKLRIQHLADMARIKLIRKYGGLWMDGSIYCTASIPEHFFRLPFYSLKNEKDNQENISNDKWTTFLLGGQKDNLLCCFLDDFFMEYCKRGKPFIDYFMFDCAIALAYRTIPSIRKTLDQIPYEKKDYRWISKHLFDKISEDLLRQMEEGSAGFCKVGWHFDDTKVNKDTLYWYLVNGENINE